MTADTEPSPSPSAHSAPSEPSSAVSSSSPSPPPAPPSTLDRDQRRQLQLEAHLSLIRRRLALISRLRASRAASLLIRPGDLLIVYSSPTNMSPLLIRPGGIFSNRYGHFHHDDFLHRPYGSRVHSRASASAPPSSRPGYVIPLPVTPELWTLSLTHRTQILYLADISLVLLQLNLLPGSVVLESGTGSGSLTVSLARTVAPTGHVHTFEFNVERVKRAKADFELLGLADVTVHHRDVVRDGFPLVEGGADAVFLDLPSPWDVVESAAATLRHLGRLASFSPCIEQVQRTVMKLEEGGWGEVRTMEVLLREIEVAEAKVERMGHRSAKDDKRKKEAQKRKGVDASDGPAKRLREAAEEAGEEVKTKVEEEEEEEETDADAMKEEVEVQAEEGQKTAQEEEVQGGEGGDDKSDEAAAAEKRRLQRVALAGAGSYVGSVVSEGEVRYPLVMKSFAVARGHTGYLTFATAYHFTDP